MDEFLEPNKNLLRLLEEYNKYGSLFIGYDFDGTVHDFHKTGAIHTDVIHLLRELKSIGCKLGCWTAYKNLDYVNNFLVEHKIPFDEINGKGIDLGYETKKPFFSALLDDRSGLIQTYQELSLLVKLVKQKEWKS